MISNLSIFGEPLGIGLLKQQVEDFQVNELIKFTPEGEGDHLYLYVQKINSNTEWVQRQLAVIAGINALDVGYAGLKDRHAITRQWFSVYAPNNKAIDFSSLPTEIKVINQTRGQKKLKNTAVAGNEFFLRIHFDALDKAILDSRLRTLAEHGFPNFFGQQRFGIEGKNIQGLISLAKGRRYKPQQRSLFISSGRSLLFNQILNQRVKQGNWNQWIEGDVVLLDGSRSIFPLQEINAEMQQRLIDFDVHPALPLYGLGDWPSDKSAKQIEHAVFAANTEIIAALEKLKVEMMPRASRVQAKNMRWQIQDQHVDVWFSLPAGAYATTLLEQIFEIHDVKSEEI